MALKQFYDGRRVLITGGTGFIGKVLVEKLLRSTSVSKVYLLIRQKKGKSPQERAAEYFDHVIFSRLKEEGREFSSRVEVVDGDVTKLGLGLSAELTQQLSAEVEVIFHGAATVRFDDTITRATEINVKGTREIILFAKSCTKLQAVVHVSSVFAGCVRSEVPEKLPESLVVSPDTLLELPDCFSEPYFADVETDLCGEYPNTYTFTKAMAENLVKQSSQGLPIGVFRPAIVISSADEPIKGWADNIFGPTGLQFGVGAGVVRAIHVDRALVAHLVPVDKVVNALLAFAWSVAVDRTKEKEINEPAAVPVLNFTSSSVNPIKWSQFIDYSLHHGQENPANQAIWCYKVYATKFKALLTVYQWLLHLLPAMLVDTFLFLSSKRPSMWKTYAKIHKFSGLLSYFSLREWDVHEEGVVRLWGRMSLEDRAEFDFNMAAVDWDSYFQNCIRGIRTHFFKETPDSIPEARRRQLFFQIMHRLLEVLFVVFVLYACWAVISMTKAFYYLVLVPLFAFLFTMCT